jgi:hypothetical protein
VWCLNQKLLHWLQLKYALWHLNQKCPFHMGWSPFDFSFFYFSTLVSCLTVPGCVRCCIFSSKQQSFFFMSHHILAFTLVSVTS